MDRVKAANDVEEEMQKDLIVNDVEEHMTIDWVALLILPRAT